MKSASPEDCLKKLELPLEYDYSAEIERKKQGNISALFLRYRR
jgi:hypothetical protein